MTRFTRFLVIALLLFLSFSSRVFSEGTAQWMPAGMRAAQEMCLMLYNGTDGNERLGTTGCTTDERIRISVSSNFANEVIYIGMNAFANTSSHFRVLDPTGVQVYPLPAGTLQPVLSSGAGNTGEGYIATLTEARNGPEEVFGAGGYDAISITPTMAGDYYIEFNGANSTSYTSIGRHQISYFDITVANANGLPEGLGNHTAIDGRLNSFQWSLYNQLSGLGNQPTDAEFFLYQADDSLVIAVQWEEVSPGGWDIAFTRNGVGASADYAEDRKSQPYTAVGKGSVVGEFPIFFNDPDPSIYPSASRLPELNFLEYDRCSGSTCFLYSITKGGQVEVLIDLNENGVFDPGTSDRLLVDNQPAGTHCLAWDDLDGLGDLVVTGQAQAVIKYQSGIFHMPLGDVEANANGFDRTLVRPASFLVDAEPGRIYYDHTEAGAPFGAADFDFDGCTVDCNIWDPSDGNQKYLNTWFSYSELRDTLIVTFNNCDKDGDGLSDVLDIDDDNDGIPDIVEMYNGDHDGDGTLDYEDPQFCTATFQGVNGWDCADGLPDPSDDLDGDGIRNAIDADFPGCGGVLGGACSNYDKDGDGIPDYLDRDSDNDGISDLLEIGGVDTDGDGVIDDLTDTDGDGLADDYDNDDTDGPDGSSPCAPQAGCLQGVSTNPLLDTDNDGITDNSRDADGDGIADWLDLDSDNDGIPDVVEAGGTDTDGNGLADNFEDTDGDGFNDIVDGLICQDSTDIDTSTFISASSTGIDNGGNANGQPNGTFAQIYQLGDLMVLDFGVNLPAGTQYVLTWRRKASYGNTAFADMVIEESLMAGAGYSTNSFSPSTDEKVNFISTAVTAENAFRYLRIGLATNADDDIDFDAAKYYYNEEQCVSGNPILISGIDTDADGEPNSYPDDDTDGDGVLDYLDLDADNDGIPDVVEAGGTDQNGDGRADNYVDTDNDGFNDDVDGDVGNNGVSENSANALQLTGSDTDSDGVPNSYPTDDFDGDGIRNQLDLDADGDGILDITEAGGTDADSDGQEDSFVDADNDGFNDNVDGDPTNALSAGDDSNGTNIASATTITGADTDNDGAPNSYPNDDFDGDERYNFLDIDADNDGIVDNTEGQGTTTYIAPEGADDDGDGIDNAYDADDANFGGTGSSFTLSDIDVAEDPDSPDYLDVDSDGDGISDLIEGHDTDEDQLADSGSPANNGVPGGNADVDEDGLLDGFDNNTASTDATNAGLDPTSHPNLTNPLTNERDWREIADRDNDGISNAQDIDDDNDGVLDEDECGIPKQDTTFSYTGGDQTYVVPVGASEIRAKIWGAGGRGDEQSTRGVGGAGGYTEITIPVSSLSSNTLVITVGEGGNSSTNGDRTYGNGGAGSEGTTNSFRNFGAGGGMSAISYVSINEPDTAIDPVVAVSDLIAIAGGGGTMPAFSNAGTNAGEGGGTSGGDATDGNTGLNGLGGNQVAGGGSTNGNPGGYLYGGNSAPDKGAGGGGYYGGGSGSFIGNDEGGGGGGSAFISNTTAYGLSIRGNVQTPPRQSDSYYIAGIGVGGNTPAQNGGNGLVVIEAIFLDCDTDGDGITNHLDLDSDNDGIPDIIEAGGVDSDDDGRVDGVFADNDNDGWSDVFDPDATIPGTPLEDGDQDGDGLENRIDLDADDDGIADIIEAGGVDSDNDGRVDNSTDTDNDGWANTFDSDNGGSALPVADNDGDDIENYLDLDSDSDGITDNVEGQTTVAFLAPLGTDTDNDGWDDRYDSDNGGTAITLSNNEGAGEPDYLDDDSDGDGLLDWIEGFDDDEDGDALNDLILRANNYESTNSDPLEYVTSDDADANGIPDFLEDTDADGVPNFLDPDSPFYKDNDQDGLINLYDDNDPQITGVASLTPDTDEDGEYDFRDIDNEVSLPVELISFEVVKFGSDVKLSWTTATETNNDFFTIERSVDGRNFEKILTKQGAGNSLASKSYSDVDPSPRSGINYYRLTQVDFDGKSERFDDMIRVVEFGNLSIEEIKIYPNPTNGEQLNLQIQNPDLGNYTIDIRTSEGKLFKQFEFNINKELTTYSMEMLQGLQLTKGVYYLRVVSRKQNHAFKFIVQ